MVRRVNNEGLRATEAREVPSEVPIVGCGACSHASRRSLSRRQQALGVESSPVPPKRCRRALSQSRGSGTPLGRRPGRRDAWEGDRRSRGARGAVPRAFKTPRKTRRGVRAGGRCAIPRRTSSSSALGTETPYSRSRASRRATNRSIAAPMLRGMSSRPSAAGGAHRAGAGARPRDPVPERGGHALAAGWAAEQSAVRRMRRGGLSPASTLNTPAHSLVPVGTRPTPRA